MQKKNYTKILIIILFFGFTNSVFAALTCTITASCVAVGEVKMMNLSDTDNAHGELSSQSNYSTFLCCSGVSGLGNSCAGLHAVLGALSGTTNAHFEENTEDNYPTPADTTTDVCISNTVVTPTVGYSNTNCNSFDDELMTISPATTNAHIGPSYTRKVCATVPSAISFDYSGVSDSTIGFGTLSTSAARYATGNTVGSASETIAHTLAVTTNSTSGYSLTVQGATLTHTAYPAQNIAAIGGTAANSATGTEQFGIRITASGGSGTVSAPYNDATKYAYAADANTNDEVASATTGDAVTTTYSVRYLANIAPVTDAGNYSTTLTYIATGNF